MTKRSLTLLAGAAAMLALAGPALAQPSSGAGGTTINVFPPGTLPPPPASSPGGAAQPAATPGGAHRATASVVGPYNRGTTQVAMEVVSLRRESGTLMLRLLAVNEGGVNANSVAMHLAVAEAYIVDPAGQRRAGVVKSASGDALVTDMSASGVPAGERRELFAQFPEPPAGTTSVNLYLRGFPPIMGVPVQ